MRTPKILLFPVSLLVFALLVHPLHAQNLTKVYVAPPGYVLGVIFTANPAFPCDIYIKDTGNLVWIDIQLSHALLEVYADGYLQLIEAGPSAALSLADGRLQKIGDISLSYENGRIHKIGGMPFYYDTGQLRGLGDLSIAYDDVRRIARLGKIPLSYANGRFRQIGGLHFDYDSNGLVQKIGGASFYYENGTLQKISGTLSGVSVIVSSVMEFRKKFPRR
jgi:hypothetical protein